MTQTMNESLSITRAGGALGAYVDNVNLADIVSSPDLGREIGQLAVQHEVS